MRGLLIENAKIIPAFVPIDITGAGANGDWVHFHHARKAAVVLMKGAWAGGTSAVTLEQATDASGTSSKALAFSYQYSGTALTNDSLAKNAVTSNTFALSTTANLFHVIEVLAQDLDLANGFDYFRVVCATPGSNADLLAGLYILYDLDYRGLPSTLPTAISG